MLGSALLGIVQFTCSAAQAFHPPIRAGLFVMMARPARDPGAQDFGVRSIFTRKGRFGQDSPDLAYLS